MDRKPAVVISAFVQEAHCELGAEIADIASRCYWSDSHGSERFFVFAAGDQLKTLKKFIVSPDSLIGDMYCWWFSERRDAELLCRLIDYVSNQHPEMRTSRWATEELTEESA